jgi:hypothetical protein
MKIWIGAFFALVAHAALVACVPRKYNEQQTSRSRMSSLSEGIPSIGLSPAILPFVEGEIENVPAFQLLTRYHSTMPVPVTLSGEALQES